MGNRNSGRRPKPTSLKVLRGNPGQRKLNENEPRPPSGEVVKPAGLSASAGLVWDELAPVAIAMGTLTVADVRPFGTMCELQSTLQQASASKDAKGIGVFTVKHEDAEDQNSELTVVIDAVLKLERETAVALRPFYELFGLTPVARARITVPKQAEPVNKWAAMGLG